MEKLTLEHLCPYLPYGLKIFNTSGGNIREMVIENSKCELNKTAIYTILIVDCYKPILRPLNYFKEWEEIFLSGLKEFEQNITSLSFEYHDDLAIECIIYFSNSQYSCTFSFQEMSFNCDIRFNQLEGFKALFKKHLDLFGLIEKGLAININDTTGSN